MCFKRIKAIILQNLFHLRHSLEDVVDTFFWSIIDMVIWGLITNYFTQLRGPVAGIIMFLLSGLILWNVVWRAQQDMSFAFLRNVWSRNFLNLFIAPLSPGEFIAATMLLGLVKITLTLSAVVLLAFFLYSFNLFVLGFWLLPFFACLIIFAWIVGILTTALIIRFGMRIQAFAWSLIVLLQPVSAVFYPVSILPSFLQKVAWFVPTSHIFEGMRQVLKEGNLSADHLIWALGLNILYFILVAYFFKFMFEKSREIGNLAKLES